MMYSLYLDLPINPCNMILKVGNRVGKIFFQPSMMTAILPIIIAGEM